MNFLKNISTEAKIMTGIAVFSLALLIGGAVYYSNNLAPVAADIDRNNPALAGNRDNAIPATGEEKVVLVEFGDFECPACKSVDPYLKDLISKYQENVTFVFRTYPIHQHSVLASRAAFAAKEVSGDPNMFFKMGEVLYEKQEEWSAASGARNQVDLFVSYAGSLGLDQNRVREILNSDKYEDVLRQDELDARTLGTRVTPTFYANGRIVEGGRLNELEAIIQEELQK
jgi:protein-disulfide isomerase